jgi:hypothetical protein
MRIRHTIGVILTVLAVSLLGMAVAVVASGQSSTDQSGDYTVPLGDYTQTTPATPTTPTPTVPQAVVPSGGNKRSPSVTQGSRPITPSTAPAPSKVTRRVDTLAFTGAEPLLIALGGVSLMFLGLLLHRRRRSARSPA